MTNSPYESSWMRPWWNPANILPLFALLYVGWFFACGVALFLLIALIPLTLTVGILGVIFGGWIELPALVLAGAVAFLYFGLRLASEVLDWRRTKLRRGGQHLGGSDAAGDSK